MVKNQTLRPVLNYQKLTQKVNGLLVNLLLAALALLCLLPIVLTLSASLTTEEAIGRWGYPLFPREFSVESYQFLLAKPDRILNAYGISLYVTAVGTVLGLFVNSLLAYALSRKTFSPRRVIAFFLYFPSLFSAGMIPYYLFVSKTLMMKNNIWILILPGLVSTFHALLMRTYFADLPQELLESARIDGAGEWRIFFQIVLPLSTPILATVALFMMLFFWNDFYQALLFIDQREMYPLQYLLYQIQANAQFLSQTPEARALGLDLPLITARMAAAVLAIGPVAIIYLFLQKYLVRGITSGAIKE